MKKKPNTLSLERILQSGAQREEGERIENRERTERARRRDRIQKRLGTRRSYECCLCLFFFFFSSSSYAAAVYTWQSTSCAATGASRSNRVASRARVRRAAICACAICRLLNRLRTKYKLRPQRLTTDPAPQEQKPYSLLHTHNYMCLLQDASLDLLYV